MHLMKLIRQLHEKGYNVLGLLPATGRAPKNGELLSPSSDFSNLAFFYLAGSILRRRDFSLAFSSMSAL